MNKSIILSFLSCGIMFGPVYPFMKPAEIISPECEKQVIKFYIHTEPSAEQKTPENFELTAGSSVEELTRQIYDEVRRITKTNPRAIFVDNTWLVKRKLVPLEAFFDQLSIKTSTVDKVYGIPGVIHLFPQKSPGLYLDCSLVFDNMPQPRGHQTDHWRDSDIDDYIPREPITLLPSDRSMCFAKMCKNFEDVLELLDSINNEVLPFVKCAFPDALGAELKVPPTDLLPEDKNTLLNAFQYVFHTWHQENDEHERLKIEGKIQSWHPMIVNVRPITAPEDQLNYIRQNGLEIALPKGTNTDMSKLLNSLPRTKSRLFLKTIEPEKFNLEYNPAYLLEDPLNQDRSLLYLTVADMAFKMGLFLKQNPLLLQTDSGQVQTGTGKTNLLETCEQIPSNDPVLVLKTTFMAMQHIVGLFTNNSLLIALLQRCVRP